ncbi:MAG TPA: peroxiredoxin [Candidatus Limnocylindrales bacterium]|nr:peroxiredoxin [Candidatus Limnocylindrales bacterium]
MLGKLKKLLGGAPAPAKLLDTGTPAPDFRAPTHDGRTIALSDLRGRKVILWFYPKADTPGCTVEGKGLCAQQAAFDALGAVILGVSFDAPPANKAFAEKFGFGYPLLCDTDRRIGMAYGACDSPSAGHARRITYVIDESGIIRHALPKVDPATHADELLGLLRSGQ